MLNSGKKFRTLRDKYINILTLVLSEKKFRNETKNHNPPFKLNGRSLTEQEVKDQLEILNKSKPSGPDGVAPRILRSALFPLLHYYLISHCNVDNFHIFGNAHM